MADEGEPTSQLNEDGFQIELVSAADAVSDAVSRFLPFLFFSSSFPSQTGTTTHTLALFSHLLPKLMRP